MSTFNARLAAAIATVCALTACRGSTGSSLPPSAMSDGGAQSGTALQLLSRLRANPASGKIQHVVFIVQENRSFNNLFYGYPGAYTLPYGYTHTGVKVKLEPVTMLSTWNVRHDATGFIQSCNGTGKIPGTYCRMNGFDLEYVGCGGSGQPPCPIKHPQYMFVPHSQSQPYFDMASQYVLGDEMFPSNFDNSSFVSHQYIIAGQAENSVNYPKHALWGCPGGPTDKIDTISHYREFPFRREVPCWDPATLGDELDAAGVSWAFYASTILNQGGVWSAYQAIKHIYHGSDWKNDVISPSAQVLTDVGNGQLRGVTWITPTYANSDHVGSGSDTGPSWVTSIVNAIGESKFWNTTAIFIMWDESGGIYDPVPPDNPPLDFDGPGVRVGLLMISPYAKKGYVSHTAYETGSILKFIEDIWGLPRLAASDSRANSPDDSFNFSQKPRKFVKFAAKYDLQYFLRQPPDHRPPDDM